MSDNDKITAAITEIFMLKRDDIKDDLAMESVDAWDSLTHMELIATLEDEFDIEFTADEIMRMTSVLAVRQAVASKR